MADDLINEGNNDDGGGGSPKWMVTFADLNSLLLCFFVLLFSFSSVDSVKYRGMVDSLQTAFGLEHVSKAIMRNPPGSVTALTPEGSMIALRNKISPQYGKSNLAKDSNTPAKLGDQEVKRLIEEQKKEVITELDQSIRHLGLGDNVGIKSHDMGVLLDIKGEILFPTGKATIKSRLAKELLGKIAPIIEEHPSYPIMIEGHTDNVPISTRNYPSNWELSSARAGAVVRIFIEKYDLPATRFTAVGYADTKPLVSNDTWENRAKNRRVNFIFIIP